MRKIHEIKAITSPVIIELIATELRFIDKGYYLVFRMLTETGYALKLLLDCKVKDLRDKDVIPVPSSKKHGTFREAKINPKLKEELADYFQNKTDDDYAFTSRHTGNRLHEQTFAKALRSVSRSHGIEPPVTASALFRTYVYHKEYLAGDDKVLRHTTGHTYETLHKYLGLDLPEDSAEAISKNSIKESFYTERPDLIIKESVRDLFNEIAIETERPDKVNAEYIEALYRLIYSMDTAITRFKKDTKK